MQILEYLPKRIIIYWHAIGLDSVSAARVADVLHAIAHDPVNPTPIIASIHQPRYVSLSPGDNCALPLKNSSQLYQKFDLVVLLSHGRALYSGPGGFAPAEYFSNAGTVAPYQRGYNVAEYLLEVANDPPVSLFQLRRSQTSSEDIDVGSKPEKQHPFTPITRVDSSESGYATTFLTQLQHLSGREWKTLKRDRSLFVTHVAVAAILGVLCG